jgi:hypothetical protein
MSSLDALEWRTSSYTNNGNCVEVAAGAVVVHVRDSKTRQGGHLSVSPESWTKFLSAVK